MAELGAASPLAGAPPLVGARVTLAERPLEAKLTVRARAPEPALLDAFAAALGLTPPLAPNTVEARGELAVLWLGPTEWRVVGPGRDHAAMLERLEGALLARQAAVVDVSDFYTTLRLAGPAARDVLAKGVSVDLHPRAFRTGDVAVTTASHLAVHLWQVADDPVYRLLVVHTYFDSLWRWLASSAAEYGCEVLAPAPYTPHRA